jgi:hypothetical protein
MERENAVGLQLKQRTDTLFPVAGSPGHCLFLRVFCLLFFRVINQRLVDSGILDLNLFILLGSQRSHDCKREPSVGVKSADHKENLHQDAGKDIAPVLTSPGRFEFNDK